MFNHLKWNPYNIKTNLQHQQQLVFHHLKMLQLTFLGLLLGPFRLQKLLLLQLKMGLLVFRLQLNRLYLVQLCPSHHRSYLQYHISTSSPSYHFAFSSSHSKFLTRSPSLESLLYCFLLYIPSRQMKSPPEVTNVKIQLCTPYIILLPCLIQTSWRLQKFWLLQLSVLLWQLLHPSFLQLV